MVKLSTLKDKIKKKKKLGFTERASAIARGLLPRKSGKFKGKKIKSMSAAYRSGGFISPSAFKMRVKI